jgi:hypothetical protein
MISRDGEMPRRSAARRRHRRHLPRIHDVATLPKAQQLLGKRCAMPVYFCSAGVPYL